MDELPINFVLRHAREQIAAGCPDDMVLRQLQETYAYIYAQVQAERARCEAEHAEG